MTEAPIEGNTTKSGESMDGGQGNVTVKYEETLVKLRKEKRARKAKLTRLKHRLRKLFQQELRKKEIESCNEEIWGILEEAKALMDEMSVIALRMKDSQFQSEIVKNQTFCRGKHKR